MMQSEKGMNFLFSMSRLKPLLFFLSSLGIVALAQPDWSPLACLLASCGGYALFWKGMLLFPTKKGRFWSATLWFALVQGFHLNWFLADRYVGGFIYLFFALLLLFLGMQFGAVSLLIPSSRRGVLSCCAVAGAWVLIEWGRLFLLSGFPWDPVGLALSGTTLGMQMASLGGVYGMSFWVILTNLLALSLFDRGERRIKSLALWGAVALAPYLFGSYHLLAYEGALRRENPPPLKALLVQTATPPEEKLSINGSTPRSPLDLWERIAALLAPYQHTRPDLLLFSEGVVPYGTHHPLYPVKDVERLCRHFFADTAGKMPSTETSYVSNYYWSQVFANLFETDVIIGLEDFERTYSGEMKAYNAAFWASPFSPHELRYEKRILVPMGEYIPFQWCKKILSKYGITDSFTRGEKAEVFPTRAGSVGVSICYEEAYGHLMRESRQKGATLLANLTNDVWYPRSRLARAHFFHGRLRAVEEGVPLLRACNTGVTCGVDAVGRTVAALPSDCPAHPAPAGVLEVEIPCYAFPTLYTRLGDFPFIGLACAFCALGALRAVRKKVLNINGLDISPLRKN